jgi:hypothetical protein
MVVSNGGRQRDVLMQAQHRLRMRCAGRARAGESFLHRCGVASRVHEKVRDTLVGKDLD